MTTKNIICTVERIDTTTLVAEFRPTYDNAPSIVIGYPSVESLINDMGVLTSVSARVMLCISDNPHSICVRQADNALAVDDSESRTEVEPTPWAEQKQLDKRTKKARNIELKSMAQWLKEKRGFDFKTSAMMKAMSAFIFPRLEELGIVTELHQRVRKNGTKAKCRYFTAEGGEYGEVRSLEKDAAGRATIATGYMFYSAGIAELLAIMGPETINQAFRVAEENN